MQVLGIDYSRHSHLCYMVLVCYNAVLCWLHLSRQEGRQQQLDIHSIFSRIYFTVHCTGRLSISSLSNMAQVKSTRICAQLYRNLLQFAFVSMHTVFNRHSDIQTTMVYASPSLVACLAICLFAGFELTYSAHGSASVCSSCSAGTYSSAAGKSVPRRISGLQKISE